MVKKEVVKRVEDNKDSFVKHIWKYLLPFLAYAFVPSIVDMFIKNEFFAYIAKAVVTGALIIYFWNSYKELKIHFKKNIFFQSLVLGFIIFVLWILPEVLFKTLPDWYFFGVSAGFNPYAFDYALWFSVLVVIIRVLGAVVIAPIIEELFVRSFLMRIIIKNDFWKVKIGAYTLFSFLITILFFGFSHSRWIPGIIAGILLNVYLYKKKDLWGCIQAHAWANWFLAIFVLISGSWGFW